MNKADLPTIQSPDEHRKQIDLSVELSNLESGHDRLLSELGGNLIHAEEIARILAADLNPSDHDGICTLLKWQEKSVNFSEIDNSSLIDRQEKKDLTSLFPAVQIPHAVQLSYLQNQWMTAEHLRFCRTLAEITRPEFQPLVTQLFGAAEPLIKEARSHVIYQKNIYADEAFLRFARELPDIKAHYADSFQKVCEQVFSGKFEYCILPLENSQDGKLARFYSLIARYDLKIVLTCEVSTADHRHSTVFGLCARQLSLLFPLATDRSTCFEFIFWQNTDQPSVGELISASEQCGFHLIRMDGLPPSDDEILMGAGYAFDLSFAVPLSSAPHPPLTDLYALMLFISSRAPTSLPLGIYRQL